MNSGDKKVYTSQNGRVQVKVSWKEGVVAVTELGRVAKTQHMSLHTHADRYVAADRVCKILHADTDWNIVTDDFYNPITRDVMHDFGVTD